MSHMPLIRLQKQAQQLNCGNIREGEEKFGCGGVRDITVLGGGG
jgi:hypothetical protein